MSSIIDALKKSDKNRTSESAANRNQIKFGNEPPKKSRRGFWALVVLLLLVAIGAFAWSQGWQHIVIAKTKQLIGSDPSKSWFDSEQAIDDNELQAVDSENSTNSKRADKLSPPTMDEIKAKTLASDQAKTAADNERLQQLDVIAARDPSAASSKTAVGDKKVQAEIVESKQQKTTAEEARKAELDSQQNRRDLKPRLKQDYLLIHQVDFEIRKNIPPVKLNVHIYDPEPENRMVVLNGVRYAMGDLIEDLVTVEDINQQGVLLKFEGIRFLIPK